MGMAKRLPLIKTCYARFPHPDPPPEGEGENGSLREFQANGHGAGSTPR